MALSLYTCRRYYVYYAPAGHEALVLRAQPSVGQIDLYVWLLLIAYLAPI